MGRTESTTRSADVKPYGTDIGPVVDEGGAVIRAWAEVKSEQAEEDRLGNEPPPLRRTV